MNPLLNSLELAFQSLILGALGSGNNVYTGKDSSNKALPCAIVAADGESLMEDPPHSGNFWVEVELSVKATAATEPAALADPTVADMAFVQSVFSIVQVSNLDVLLNSQGQSLTVFPTGFFFMSPKSGRDELGAWVDQLKLRVYCCQANLLP